MRQSRRFPYYRTDETKLKVSMQLITEAEAEGSIQFITEVEGLLKLKALYY
jgi:hypothetical protein